MSGVGSLTEAISDYQKQGKQVETDVTSGVKAAQEKLDTRLKSDDEKADALSDGALKPPTLSPAPQAQQTDPLKIWGSSAMWLAALGGVMSRHHLTNSLNAAAGVLQSYHAQDSAAAKQQFDAWKTETDNAVKMATFSIDAYKESLAKVDSDRKGALADFTATAKALGDEQAAYVAQSHGLDAAVRYVDAMQSHVDKMTEAMPKVEDMNTRQQNISAIAKARKDLIAAQKTGDQTKITEAQNELQFSIQNMQDYNAGMSKSGGTSFSTMTDDDFKSMAEQYLAGDKSVLTSLGYGSAGAANRARLQEEIRKVAKDKGLSGADIAANMAEFAGTTAGERTLGTTAARIGLGAAEMQTLVPLVKEASKELPRSEFPTMNAFIQGAQRERGDTRLRNLAVRLQGLKSAYSQVLTRGGVPTDSARNATDELFATKDPDTVLETVLDAIGQETSAIEAAPGIVRGQLRQGITGEKPASTSTSGWKIEKVQ
jgi:hypothetical protein